MNLKYLIIPYKNQNSNIPYMYFNKTKLIGFEQFFFKKN